jgi:hypothetical protein
LGKTVGESFQTRWQASLAALDTHPVSTTGMTTSTADASPAQSQPLPTAPARAIQADRLGNRNQGVLSVATDGPGRSNAVAGAQTEIAQAESRFAALRQQTANPAVAVEQSTTAARAGNAPANAASKDEKAARSSQQKSSAAAGTAAATQEQTVPATADAAAVQQPVPLPNMPTPQPQPATVETSIASAVSEAGSEDRAVSFAPSAVPEVLCSLVSPAGMRTQQGSSLQNQAIRSSDAGVAETETAHGSRTAHASNSLSEDVETVAEDVVAPAAHSVPMKTAVNDPVEAKSQAAARQTASAALTGSTATAAPDAAPSLQETQLSLARFAADSGKTSVPGEEKAASAISKHSTATSAVSFSAAATTAAVSAPIPHFTQAVVQPVQGADASVVASDMAALRSGQDSSTGASVSVASSGNTTSTTAEAGHATFAALDASAVNGTASWTHASARHAEAGYQDPALGWVGVRADLNGGAVHASLVPSSTEAAQTLSSHLVGLHSYLNEQHTPVDSLTMSSPEGQGTMGGSSRGTDGNGAGAQQQQTGETVSSSGVTRSTETSSSGMGAQDVLPMIPEGSHISLVA